MRMKDHLAREAERRKNQALTKKWEDVLNYEGPTPRDRPVRKMEDLNSQVTEEIVERITEATELRVFNVEGNPEDYVKAVSQKKKSNRNIE